jgi:hypothetical protein
VRGETKTIMMTDKTARELAKAQTRKDHIVMVPLAGFTQDSVNPALSGRRLGEDISDVDGMRAKLTENCTRVRSRARAQQTAADGHPEQAVDRPKDICQKQE